MLPGVDFTAVCTTIVILILGFSLLLLLSMAVMAAQDAWMKVMEAACIPEPVQVKLKDAGYVTEESFDFKDDATFEAFVQHMLVHKKIVDGVDQASWSFHPLCGQLRNLWKRLSKQGTGSVAVATLSPAASAAGVVQQLASSCAKSLSVVERDRLRRELEKKYTGALITERTLPCMSLLNMVHAQKLQGAWEWISWKKLLSEQAAVCSQGPQEL